MKCVICKYGETASEKITVTFDQNGAIVVIRQVPARVCQTCGEEYVDEEVAIKLLQIAENADLAYAQKDVKVDVRSYVAAA